MNKYFTTLNVGSIIYLLFLCKSSVWETDEDAGKTPVSGESQNSMVIMIDLWYHG